jgi:thymidylate synthase
MNKGMEFAPRGIPTHELLGYQTVVDMKQPMVTVFERQLGYRFLCAEAHWILTGDNRVETIAPYSKTIANFSDDGETFFGAYGPSIMEQFGYCRQTLIKDRHSRQAVLTTWRKNPPETKDVPCTLTTQFIIRSNYLHTIHSMRSSDIWLGWPYDVFNFTMLAACMLLDLKNAKPEEFKDLELGKLFFTAGSQHLYKKNFDQAYNCHFKQTCFAYKTFNPSEFSTSNELIAHLGALKDKKETPYHAFKELITRV